MKQNRVKRIKICTFWGKSFPHAYSFPPPVLLFGRIFTYDRYSFKKYILASSQMSNCRQEESGHWTSVDRKYKKVSRSPVHSVLSLCLLLRCSSCKYRVFIKEGHKVNAYNTTIKYTFWGLLWGSS